MAIEGLLAAVVLARSVTTPGSGGIWQVIGAHIARRKTVAVERERRRTLLTVPSTLPPGTQIYDLRADGSVLLLSVPRTAEE